MENETVIIVHTTAAGSLGSVFRILIIQMKNEHFPSQCSP